MSIRIVPAFLFATALLAGSAAAGVTVVSTRGINLLYVYTYSWGHVDTDDPSVDQPLRAAIDRQLRAVGLSEVPSGGDLTVDAIIETGHESKVEAAAMDSSRPALRFQGAPAHGRKAGTRTLVVHISDGSSKVIWRGVATGTLSANADKNSKTLSDNVRKMFKRFPPESRSHPWLSLAAWTRAWTR